MRPANSPDFSPGHANDHVSLLHRGAGGMFTGDNVLGVGTSVFRDLHDYMNSLKRMQRAAVKDNVKMLYTSHGPLGKLVEVSLTDEVY